MESWRRAWRAFQAHISTPALESLRRALVADDARLLQGATTTPPPLQCVQSWPVEAACIVGACGVEECGGWGVATVYDVEEYFARRCFDVDQDMCEPAAGRWFLNWADETPRAEVFAQLLPEVNRELARRAAGAGATSTEVA
jgi:hypothetical protein